MPAGTNATAVNATIAYIREGSADLPQVTSLASVKNPLSKSGQKDTTCKDTNDMCQVNLVNNSSERINSPELDSRENPTARILPRESYRVPAQDCDLNGLAENRYELACMCSF